VFFYSKTTPNTIATAFVGLGLLDAYELAGNREVLDLATGLVVHSRYVEEGACAAGFERPIRRVPLAASPPEGIEPERLGPGPVIGSFGHVNPAKRIPQLIAAFSELRRFHPDAQLLLVGSTAPRFDIAGHLARYGLERSAAVVRLEWVSEERFWSLMTGCDVCVNLRAPTMGETSASAVQTLALGRALVVSDLGWFAELPDGVAVKVPIGEHEVETLTAALELLASDDELRAKVGEAARDYARAEHDLGRTADAYVDLLELAAGGPAIAQEVLWEVARAAAEVGIGADSPELTDVAAQVRDLRLVP
jgi:glycosyltransferase involved in cell wall biosynthesis